MTLVDWLQKRILLILLVMLLLFMAVEFVILSTVGTMGPDISNVRSQTEKLKLDNEIKQATIRQLQTSEEVSTSVEYDLEMSPRTVDNVQAIEEISEEVTAGNSK